MNSGIKKVIETGQPWIRTGMNNKTLSVPFSYDSYPIKDISFLISFWVGETERRRRQIVSFVGNGDLFNSLRS